MFDVLVDTQAQMVDNFNEATKKFQESFIKNEAFEKSAIFFQEQLASIQSSLESGFAHVKKQMNLEAMPTPIKDIVEATEGLAKSWFECLRATVQAKSLEDLNQIVSANFKKAQESAKEIYNEITEKMTKMPDIKEIFSVEEFKKNLYKMVEHLKPVYNLK